LTSSYPARRPNTDCRNCAVRSSLRRRSEATRRSPVSSSRDLCAGAWTLI
jgi:hypothetical protein